MVCSARGAADALDAVDWDALFQLSTRHAKRRLLFGTTTRRRRADVFWLWDEGLQQLRRRSWSRWLEPRQTAKRLRAGHDVVGSYRARTMEATRRRAGCAHASITSLPRLGFDNQAVVVFVCDVAPVKRPLASLACGRPPIPPPKTGPKLAEPPCCIIRLSPRRIVPRTPRARNGGGTARADATSTSTFISFSSLMAAKRPC